MHNASTLALLTAGLLIVLPAHARASDTVPADSSEVIELFSEENLPRWQPTAAYQQSPEWQYDPENGFHGKNSWVAFPEGFRDFILTGQFLFTGNCEGGIVLRGDSSAQFPWESGYELDFKDIATPGYGHIHFPVKPRPYSGEDARITTGQWHRLRVEAVGHQITVFLDDQQVLQFEDTEFTQGQILLEGCGHGVHYRNLAVQPL